MLNGKIIMVVIDWFKVIYFIKWICEDFECFFYLIGNFFYNLVCKWFVYLVYDLNGFFMDEGEVEQMENGGK